MRASGVILLSTMLVAACAHREAAPPYFVIPPGPAVQAHAAPAESAEEAEPQRRRVPHVPNPEVQEFLPSHPEDVGREPAPVPRPAAPTEPFYAQPPNVGPVTGYGPGGMALPPGAPPNPPYPPGGLTGVH